LKRAIHDLSQTWVAASVLNMALASLLGEPATRSRLNGRHAQHQGGTDPKGISTRERCCAVPRYDLSKSEIKTGVGT
jgi:hypothetical protein